MTQILNKHDEVKKVFEKYTESLAKTNERRQLWKSETKGKIVEILNLVEKTFTFDWHVQRIENVENYQTINISCDSRTSGMIETITDNETGQQKRKAYVKYGGYLAFCQSYNGKINVIIGFPYIEEWVLPMDVKVIDTIEPSKVTEELISEYIIKFLQTMTEWEGQARLPVGFKN